MIKNSTVRVNAAPSQKGPSAVLIEERVWIPISTSPRCDHSLKPISKRAQIILRRPKPHVRELDGAVYWPEVMRIMYDSYPDTHYLGIVTSGSTRYQLDQTRSELSVVLTRMGRFST